MKITLSEKFALIAMNEKGKVSKLSRCDCAIYVAALLELYKAKIVSNYNAVKIVEKLPEEYGVIQEMYNFVQENQGKSLEKILKSFTNPFNGKRRKVLFNDVMAKVHGEFYEKGENIYKSEAEKIVDKVRTQEKKIDDLDSVILGKLMLEFGVAKRYLERDERKNLKKNLKNSDELNLEFKELMKVIDALAVAGALAGAGAV